jgi:hypothetical protein
MAQTKPSMSVSGRDDLVLSQALIYAIALIQSLPARDQSYSNMCDMCAIARTFEPTALGLHIFEVQQKTGLAVDIWPEDDADLSVTDRHSRKAFKFALATFIAELGSHLTQFAAAHTLDPKAAA